MIFENKINAIPRLKLLVYAYAGTGKTWMAAANPKLKVLYLYTERQAESTIAIVRKAGAVHPESEFIFVENTQVFFALKDKIEANLNKFNLLVFDTLDDYEEMASTEIAMASKTPTKTAAACDDYGRSAASRDAELAYLITWIRNLDIHVLALAHPLEREIVNGEVKKNRMEIRFAGKKNSDAAAQKFNAVAMMSKRRVDGNEVRLLTFRGRENMLLKDLPYFDDKEPADYTALLKKHVDYYRSNEQKGE
jgi:hypothetical protein